MLQLTVVLSCMIVGSFAYTEECEGDMVLGRALMEVRYLPNKEQLRSLCPQLFSFFECEKAAMESSGQSLDEWTNSSIRVKAKQAMALLGGSSLVRELCDEESSLHNDYVASVSCYREQFEESFLKCRRIVSKAVTEFYDQLYAEDGTNKFIDKYSCVKKAYEFACIIDNLGGICGSVARRAALNALGRLKHLMGGNNCIFVKNATDLKSRFLNFLELDEQKRNSAQEVFDLVKRRR